MTIEVVKVTLVNMHELSYLVLKIYGPVGPVAYFPGS